MENKKMYSKPQITDSVNLEAIAGACTGGKLAGNGAGCAVFVNS
jgi:hypothetical protein